jgi:hypothetical protein
VGRKSFGGELDCAVNASVEVDPVARKRQSAGRKRQSHGGQGTNIPFQANETVPEKHYTIIIGI